MVFKSHYPHVCILSQHKSQHSHILCSAGAGSSLMPTSMLILTEHDIKPLLMQHGGDQIPPVIFSVEEECESEA